MRVPKHDCCVWNGGRGAWAFEPLAQALAGALGVAVSAEPRRFNYLLNLDSAPVEFPHRLFIPLASIQVAADKRLTAVAFERSGVPTPRTFLVESFDEVITLVSEFAGLEWCLKYPTGCGANGHRMVAATSPEPPNWPRPFILQEFVPLQRPEVYRIYSTGGELFGWVARRFPAGHEVSPWVAHARGARYEQCGEAPQAALDAARTALMATGLLETFGCVDLLCRDSGEWVVLEVGTDGIFNHVDRELGITELEAELLHRVAQAFWKRAVA